MKNMMIAAAMVAAAGGAQAQDLGAAKPYVGLDLVHTWVDYQDDADVVLDDTLKGVNPYVGAMLTPNVGVEVGYLATEVGTKSTVISDGKTQIYGPSVDVVGVVPGMENCQFKVLGMAGVGYYNGKVAIDSPILSGTANEWDLAPRVGVGAQYQLTDQLAARATLRYIHVDFDDTTDSLTTASVGLNYKF